MSLNRYLTSRILALQSRGWKYNRRKGQKGWTRVAEGGHVLKALNVDKAYTADVNDWTRVASMPRRCRIEQKRGTGVRAKWVWVASSWTFHNAEQMLMRDFFCDGRVIAFDEKTACYTLTGEEKED